MIIMFVHLSNTVPGNYGDLNPFVVISFNLSLVCVFFLHVSFSSILNKAVLSHHCVNKSVNKSTSAICNQLLYLYAPASVKKKQ